MRLQPLARLLPPVGVVDDPREARLGAQHAVRRGIDFVAEEAEDACDEEHDSKRGARILQSSLSLCGQARVHARRPCEARGSDPV